MSFEEDILINELIVGLDDSNHAGTSSGEIDVAVFSTIPKDIIVKNFGNRRSYSELINGLKDYRRDYRFSILTSKRYRANSQNLIEIAPELIKNYLDIEEFSPKILRVYFDGCLKKGSRNFLRNIFLDFKGIENVVIDNFIKKNKNSNGRMSKGMYCPKVVYFADILSNYLYSTQTFEKLTTNPKLVSIK